MSLVLEYLEQLPQTVPYMIHKLSACPLNLLVCSLLSGTLLLDVDCVLSQCLVCTLSSLVSLSLSWRSLWNESGKLV